MSKIQIWKRITTMCGLSRRFLLLYLICQRYKFESESQLFHVIQDFKLAVFNMSKIQIWKRITTSSVSTSAGMLLYLICQRYKFESESQRPICYEATRKAVFNMSKIQIWKRITTQYGIVPIRYSLYLICQRYKFESESQHHGNTHSVRKGCI